jgi:hypothetical protein
VVRGGHTADTLIRKARAMIIIEGPDHAGKTTLVKKLSGELDVEVAPIYATSRRMMQQQGVRRRVWSGLSALLRGQVYIHDRLYLSELIYGSVIRGSCEFSVPERSWIEDTLDQFGVPIIVCLPPLSVIRENFEPLAHIPNVGEQIEVIYESYYNFVVHRNYRAYDYTSKLDTVEDLLDWIQPRLTQMEMTFGTTDGRRTSGVGAGAERGSGAEDST